MKKYFPVFDSWGEKQFLTLTVRNCQADELADTVEAMYQAFHRILKHLCKYSKVHLRGVRKLECTYNVEEKTYHPHFHILFEGTPEDGERLIQMWMAKFFDRTDRAAQNCMPANRESIIELFKYFTKVISKARSTQNRIFCPEAMDVIFRAIQGRRTFQSFGFLLPKEEMIETVEDSDGVVEAWKEVEVEIMWSWSQAVHDWTSDGGEVLTEYEPTVEDKELVQRIVEMK